MRKEAFYVNQVADAIIRARTANSSEGTQIPTRQEVAHEIRVAKTTVLIRDEGIRAERNTYMFPEQLGEVLDEVSRNIDAIHSELPIEQIDIWRAEEDLRGLPHDPAGFIKRQEQRVEYALIQEAFPIS